MSVFLTLDPKNIYFIYFYLFLHFKQSRYIHTFLFFFASQSFHQYPPLGGHTVVVSCGQLQMSILYAWLFKPVSSFWQIYSQTLGWCILYFASNIYLFVCFTIQTHTVSTVMSSGLLPVSVLLYTLLFRPTYSSSSLYTQCFGWCILCSTSNFYLIICFAIQTIIPILAVILSILWLVYSPIY